MKWFEALTVATREDIIPKDFYTREEMAKCRGCSVETVRRLLKPELAAGRVIRKMFRAKGQPRKMHYYGPAKAKSN